MTDDDERRTILADAHGTPVLTYLEGVRDGHPWADMAEVVGPRAVDLIVSRMSGWAVSGSVELGEALVRRGAQVMRHAHSMRRDLTARPPVRTSSDRSLPGGLRAVPCDRPAHELFPAWRAAFPPEHPDHVNADDGEALRGQLAPLLAGKVLGPVMSCSSLAVDETGHVVAGVVVTDRDGLPWMAEAFREPGPRHAGLGAALLRLVLADAAKRGLAEIALAVSDGNPARRVYEQLGFVLTNTSLTVHVP